MNKAEIIARGKQIYAEIEAELKSRKAKFVVINVTTNEYLVGLKDRDLVIAARAKFGSDASLYLHRVGAPAAFSMSLEQSNQ